MPPPRVRCACCVSRPNVHDLRGDCHLDRCLSTGALGAVCMADGSASGKECALRLWFWGEVTVSLPLLKSRPPHPRPLGRDASRTNFACLF
eukprot:6183056-Pleurochrysis_carterae.AAC.1